MARRVRHPGRYWLAFALHPLPAPDFTWEGSGCPADWPHPAGFAAHWEKNANFAARFDRWFLNLFPRPTAFVYSEGGYQTLNFVPSLATMIFGMQAGWLLAQRSDPRNEGGSYSWLSASPGLSSELIAAAGSARSSSGSGRPPGRSSVHGVVALALAVFYAVIDWQGWRRWASRSSSRG